MDEKPPRRPRISGHVKAVLSPSSAERLVVPEYDAVLGQPNPFPIGHRFHQEWESRRRSASVKAAEGFARVAARPTNTWSDVIEGHLDWWPTLFDIRAEALLFPMAPADYSSLLQDEADAILSGLRARRLPIGDELLKKLLVLLHQRHAHWMARVLAQDEALRAALQARKSPTTRKRSAAAFPVRAKWLQEQMLARSATMSGLYGAGGPDKKSIKRILAGYQVSDGVLEKLTVALGAFGRPVDLVDIPHK